MSANNEEVAAAYAKVAAIEEKATEVQNALRVEVNNIHAEIAKLCLAIKTLESKRARLVVWDKDLDEMAKEAISMLRDESLLVRMMEEKDNEHCNRTMLGKFTDKAEDMIEEADEDLETISRNNNNNDDA